MGSFVFKPNSSKNYYVKLDSTEKKQYALPEIKNKGYVLQLIENIQDTITLKVIQNATLVKETIYIRVQVKGIVYSIAKTRLDKVKNIRIPLKGIPQGIAEVTLFNKNLYPLAERLVYLNHNQKIYIQAVLDKEKYLTKELVKIRLKATDQNNTPVVAHLGLSVFDALYKNPRDSKTIETHFHLTEQLKGKLYNPDYYFNTKNTNRKDALDLLLLTQGWRKYVWNESNLKDLQIQKKAVINDTIAGTISIKKNKRNEIKLQEQYLMAFNGFNQSSKSFIEVNNRGGFKIFPTHLEEAKGGYLYLKLLGNEDIVKNLSIDIAEGNFKKINRLTRSKYLQYPIKTKVEQVKEDIPLSYLSAKNVNKLEEVVVKGEHTHVFRDKYMGTLDSLAKLNINTDYVCISNYLNCPIHLHSDKNTIPVEGVVYKQYTGFKWNANGTYTIRGIKTEKYSYPKYTDAELLKKFNLVSIKGNYPKKIFYEPVYDTKEQNDGFPDYRNTLYWKPDIITDENGEATISFHCSDINTKFIGVIEGVSGDGYLGTQNFEFFVRKRK